MKIAFAALTLFCLATPALAISRYNSLDKTCAAVQQSIAREKAVLLSYPSRDGRIRLYDRYVAGRGQCDAGYYAGSDYVPTADNKSCPVLSCKSASDLQPR